MKRKITITILLLLSFSFVLSSCSGESPTSEPPPSAEPVSSPTATSPLSTPELQPTAALQPTLELTATSIPTAYPIQGNTPAVDSCPYEYFFRPAPDTCPSSSPVVTPAAEQPFEEGVMVWLEATDSIIVIYNDQSWVQLEDTWTEVQPESDPSIVPPADRFQPIRGFGKVWRENPDIREKIGWALGKELGFDTTFQGQTADEETPETTFLLLFNGKVAALTKRDGNSGDWVIASSP